jgi:hypothetical protein
LLLPVAGGGLRRRHQILRCRRSRLAPAPGRSEAPRP